MAQVSQARRRFCKAGVGLAAASALALPRLLREALAVPAAGSTGTLRDVEHIVVFTQENRSFDHYFGALRGVRGFDDRNVIRMETGAPSISDPAAS
jgi:phospholipase C